MKFSKLKYTIFYILYYKSCTAVLLLSISTIEGLTADQTEQLVWGFAGELREIFEGKVYLLLVRPFNPGFKLALSHVMYKFDEHLLVFNCSSGKYCSIPFN